MSVNQLPERLSVSFNTDMLSEMYSDGILEGVSVDADVLCDVLDSYGEFEFPDRKPLEIMLDSVWHPDDIAGGLCTLEEDDEGKEVRRIYAPLFALFENKNNNHRYVLDDKFVNRVLAHELRHAVDYNDAELLQQHQDEKLQMVKWYERRQKMLKVGGAACLGMFALSFGMAIAEDQTWPAVTAAGGAGFLLATRKKITKVMNEWQVGRILTKTPLEKRAYEVTPKLNEDKIPQDVPQIVTIKFTDKLHEIAVEE